MPHPNQRILETTPYLLQHAHNPVNCLPYGNDLFGVLQQETEVTAGVAMQTVILFLQ